MTKARNRRNKRIKIDAARENLHKLNADLSDQIDCRKAAEAVHPGTTPLIKGHLDEIGSPVCHALSNF
jgi:hypothetical protein